MTVSPPRRVFAAVSGLPPRPKMIGSTFWAWVVSSRTILREVVGGLQRARRGARGDDVGGLRAAALRERDLAEAAELEVLGHRHRLRERHEHALVALEVGGGRHREAHLGRSDRAGAADRDRPALTWVWPWFSPALPVTVTRSPSSTVSALLPSKTKIASEVAGSPSPFAVLDEEAPQRRARRPRSRRRRRRVS